MVELYVQKICGNNMWEYVYDMIGSLGRQKVLHLINMRPLAFIKII